MTAERSRLAAWIDSPWYFVYVGVASAALVALLHVIWGDGVDWFNVVLLAAAATVGAYIGRRLRARRRA